MPEKGVFLPAWNTENKAPVHAGLLFLPEPRITERSQKQCSKESKSDTEPWKAFQKRLRNYMAKSCLKKPENVAKGRPSRTPEAAKNHLRTDPEIHLGPHGPIIWPKVARSSHFTAQTSHVIDFGYHFASFLKGICDLKAANQASAEAENFSSILHISSRVRELYLLFKGRRQCFTHQYYHVRI